MSASKQVAVFGADAIKNMEVCAALAKISADKFGGKQIGSLADGPQPSYEVKGPVHSYVLDYTDMESDKKPDIAVRVVSAKAGRSTGGRDEVYTFRRAGCERFAAFITDCFEEDDEDDASTIKRIEQSVQDDFAKQDLNGIEIITGSTSALYHDEAKFEDAMLKLFDALERRTV